MRKKVWKRGILPVCILLILAGAMMHIPNSGALPITRRIYADIVIRQLEENIEFTGDNVSFQDGQLHSFQIGSRESAEVLYSCIQNAAQLNDYTNACLAPEVITILVNEACEGTFGKVYYTLPVSGRFICFQFTEEDEDELREYIMTIAREKAKAGSAIRIEK